jgi:WD40 repeat protein
MAWEGGSTTFHLRGCDLDAICAICVDGCMPEAAKAAVTSGVTPDDLSEATLMRIKRTPLRRAAWTMLASVGVVLGACGGSDDTDANDATTRSTQTTTTEAPSGPPGPIVFKRLNPATDETDIYTVNPDGSDVRLLLRGPAEGALWSPDGTEISVFCCDDGMAAHFVDVASGELRTIPQPDPTLETFCGGAWSPDGERVACEIFGVDDPNLNGLYSIRASDGGDLTRITSNPGGSDLAGDYSPDGTRLVFVRFVEEGAPPVGMFVINVDGSELRQLTPPDMILDEDGFAGRWSPDGSSILVVARTAADRKAIWVVNADGGDPEPLAITPACGGAASEPGQFGCYSPSWSPDGKQIVFVRSDGSKESIYIVNADGSGIVQVTDGEDDQPHWGTPR